MIGSGTVELTVHGHEHPTGDASDGAPDQVADKAPVDAVKPGPLAWLLLHAVRFYRAWISPVLPPSCRFEPSCSAYALEALTVHGALRGTWLTLCRLLRCGPWHPGGWDPVPPRRTRNRPDEPSTADPARPSAAEE